MATLSDLTLALIVKAQTDQARASLGALQAQLQGVEVSAQSAGTTAAAGVSELAEASSNAAASVGSTAEALTGAAAATTQVGETAEQAAARIHAMVTASMQAVNAERARAQSAIESATASRVAAGANGDQVKSTAELVVAQNAQMATSSRVVAAQAQIAAAVEAKTLTEAQSLEAENMINRARGAGLITAAEQRQAIEQLAAVKIVDAKITEDDTKALAENTIASKLNSRSRREVGTMFSEFASGNFGRVRTSGLALANDMGLFSKLLSPVGLGIVGVVAALGALAVAFAKGENETSAYNKALILTGNYSGETVGQLQVLAQETAKVTDTTQHAAAATVAAVVQSGKFYGATVGLVSQAAVAMQQSTGQAVDKTVAEFAKLADDPVKASLALNTTTHYLTQSIYDQITAMIERGDKDQAAEVAQKAYADAQIARANAVKENLGGLERVWESVTHAAKDAWDAMLDVGRQQTPETRIAQLRSALADQQKLLASGGQVSTGGSGLAGGADIGGVNVGISPDVIKANIARIQQQITAAVVSEGFATTGSRTSAMQQRLTDQALAARNELASGVGTSALTKRDTRLNALAVEKTQALYGVVDPATREKIIASFKAQVDDAQAQYKAAVKKLTPHGPKGPDLDKLQGNADVAAVQDSLAIIQNAYKNADAQLATLRKTDQIGDKAYYDGLRADLAQYVTDRTAALEKEKAEVLAHATTQAQRIQANQKAAQIDAEITKTQQDAATKRMQIDADEKASIDKTAKAWAELESSLGEPVDVNTAAAMKKLQDLYELVQKLKDEGNAPGEAQVDKMVGAALTTGVNTQQPRMRSARLIPGADNRDNPLAMVNQDQQNEQAWFKSQQVQLAANYKAAQAAYAGNAERLLQLQQQYQQSSDALTQQDAQRKKQLNQAKYWGELDTAQSVFGQLAALSSSHSKKVAAIGKAAAIVDAVITTYKNATTAYGEGLVAGGPYAGPALGAAYAAIAIAAGLANVAAIRSQSTGAGYAAGGYTGAGAKHQVAGFVHAGEVVYSQADVARHGGVAAVEAYRLRGYADGGFVHPMDNAPSPAQLGFAAPTSPRMDISKLAAANDDARRQPQLNVKNVVVFDREQLAEQLMNTAAGHKVIVHVVGDNPRTIQGKWQAG